MNIQNPTQATTFQQSIILDLNNFFVSISASMFYPLFAIASQLSPEKKSSGIEILEADTFRLHCYQTLTGRPSTVVFFYS